MTKDKPTVSQRFIALLPDSVQERFEIRSRQLLAKSAELESGHLFNGAFRTALEAAEHARLNSGVQDKAMAKVEELVPKLGERAADEPMGAIQAGTHQRRIDALNAKRAPKP